METLSKTHLEAINKIFDSKYHFVGPYGHKVLKKVLPFGNTCVNCGITIIDDTDLDIPCLT